MNTGYLYRNDEFAEKFIRHGGKRIFPLVGYEGTYRFRIPLKCRQCPFCAPRLDEYSICLIHLPAFEDHRITVSENERAFSEDCDCPLTRIAKHVDKDEKGYEFEYVEVPAEYLWMSPDLSEGFEQRYKDLRV